MIHEIIKIVSISDKHGFIILCEHLYMRKLSAKFAHSYQNSTTKSKQCFVMFKPHSGEFLKSFVKSMKYELITTLQKFKEQSKLWISLNEHVPKKAKMVLSDEMVMAIILWDSHGIIFISYRKNYHRTGLCLFIKSISWWIGGKAIPLGDEKILYHQTMHHQLIYL